VPGAAANLAGTALDATIALINRRKQQQKDQDVAAAQTSFARAQERLTAWQNGPMREMRGLDSQGAPAAAEELLAEVYEETKAGLSPEQLKRLDGFWGQLRVGVVGNVTRHVTAETQRAREAGQDAVIAAGIESAASTTGFADVDGEIRAMEGVYAAIADKYRPYGQDVVDAEVKDAVGRMTARKLSLALDGISSAKDAAEVEQRKSDLATVLDNHAETLGADVVSQYRERGEKFGAAKLGHLTSLRRSARSDAVSGLKIDALRAMVADDGSILSVMTTGQELQGEFQGKDPDIALDVQRVLTQLDGVLTSRWEEQEVAAKRADLAEAKMAEQARKEWEDEAKASLGVLEARVRGGRTPPDVAVNDLMSAMGRGDWPDTRDVCLAIEKTLTAITTYGSTEQKDQAAAWGVIADMEAANAFGSRIIVKSKLGGINDRTEAELLEAREKARGAMKGIWGFRKPDEDARARALAEINEDVARSQTLRMRVYEAARLYLKDQKEKGKPISVPDFVEHINRFLALPRQQQAYRESIQGGLDNRDR